MYVERKGRGCLLISPFFISFAFINNKPFILNRMKKRILLFLSLLALCVFSGAHNYMFRHLEVADGLSNNTVYAIYKDADGFMWFGTRSGLNRFDGYAFKVYRHLNNEPHSLPDNCVTGIQETPDGQLWIKTERSYALFDKRKGTFVSDLSGFMQKLGSKGKMPSCVYVDKKGYTWLFVQGEGVYRYKQGEESSVFLFQENRLPVSGVCTVGECREGVLLLYDNGLLVCVDASDLHLKWIKDDIVSQIPEGKYTHFSSYTDAQDCVWIYSVLGVWIYDASSGRWLEEMAKPWRGQQDFVHAVAQDKEGRIWLAKDYKGIDVFDKRTGEVVNLVNEEQDARSLSHNTVYSLYADRSGIVWAGTYKKGVSYYDESMFKFDMRELGDITCVEQEDEERVWLGTNDNGLLLWNFKTGEVEKDAYAGDLSANPVVSLLKARDGRLWAGTFNGGLYCIDGGKVSRYTPASDGLAGNNVWTLAEDGEGNLWIGYLDAGIQCFRPGKGVLGTYQVSNSDLPDKMISSLCVTPDNTLVIGSVGMAFMDLSDKRIYRLPASEPNGRNFSVNQVFCDSRGLIWIATTEGLKMYDRKSRAMKDFPRITGEEGEMISGITEDREHDLWISSTRRMVHLKVSRGEDGAYVFDSYVYNDRDGLQNCDFNLRSIKTLDDGTIVAGGLYGVNVFNPDKIRYNKSLPKVLLSGLYLFGKEVEAGTEYDGNVILERELNETEEIELGYKQNIFTLELATDNFSLPEKTQYLYQLEGAGKDWLALPVGVHRLSFTNLASGSYLLKVKAINSDGYKGEEVTRLRIVIRPPFWLSWWAYAFYLLIGIGALMFARRLTLNREREKFRMQQIEQEAARKEEINQMKFRFFTNISHELRTPLTLIIAPLEELLKNTKDESEKNVLQLMYRNAHRLLVLVNQLLDFRKGEMSGHQLSLSEGDIVAYIHEVCNSFLLMADKKRIQFSFFSGVESFSMAFDVDKIGKVVMNLLSNAFKFTPEGGRVTVMLEHVEGEKEMLEIKVSDTGIGIPDEEKEHIFDRFYQAEHKGMEETTGSGIGLSLVHDFIRLHEGTVEVFDNIGTGTVFVVHLPVKHADVLAELPKPTLVETDENQETLIGSTDRDSFPLVLVVDDNEDFRLFMRHSLELQYRVILASNGKEAWEKVQNEHPDLVISDVMMPGMDGNELCRLIKEDKRTAHVPVILLTARQAVESRVKGLQTGADDYVTKPFNMTVLVLRIRKLIELSRYKQATQATIDPTPSDIVITSLDEKLIEKAIKYVEDNISRSDLSVEELSRELGMSRVHLYKKLLQITGKSPIEFIRVIRLKRAAQLLRESQLHVSEVAYEVGFNNPKYFSRYFKEEFGVLPSAYQEKEGK